MANLQITSGSRTSHVAQSKVGRVTCATDQNPQAITQAGPGNGDDEEEDEDDEDDGEDDDEDAGPEAPSQDEPKHEITAPRLYRYGIRAEKKLKGTPERGSHEKLDPGKSVEASACFVERARNTIRILCSSPQLLQSGDGFQVAVA